MAKGFRSTGGVGGGGLTNSARISVHKQAGTASAVQQMSQGAGRNGSRAGSAWARQQGYRNGNR